MLDQSDSSDYMPSPMPWVKLYTEMIDDLKVRRLSERAQLRFVQLILLAGVCDCEGTLAMSGGPMSDEDIAWRLRVPLETLSADMIELAAPGLVKRTPEGWLIPAFAERQGRKHSDDRARWRGLKARQRAKNVLNVSSEDTSEDTPEDTPEESSGGPQRVPRKEGEESRGEESRGEGEGEDGAGAPTPPESPKAAEPAKSRKTDPRTKAPEIQVFFRITGQYPNRQLYEDVISATQGRTEKQLAPYYKEWLARGYNPKALTWLTEWAAAGTIPGRHTNGNSKGGDKAQAALAEYRNRRGLNGK